MGTFSVNTSGVVITIIDISVKDMSVTAKTVLTSMNALTEISMIVITTPDVLTLKVHMNANVMLVSDQEWILHSNQMDVLILMNVSKEVIIATHMLRVTTREEHFIVNVTLVSKVVVLPVMILMNAHPIKLL